MQRERGFGAAARFAGAVSIMAVTFYLGACQSPVSGQTDSSGTTIETVQRILGNADFSLPPSLQTESVSPASTVASASMSTQAVVNEPASLPIIRSNGWNQTRARFNDTVLLRFLDVLYTYFEQPDAVPPGSTVTLGVVPIAFSGMDYVNLDMGSFTWTEDTDTGTIELFWRIVLDAAGDGSNIMPARIWIVMSPTSAGAETYCIEAFFVDDDDANFKYYAIYNEETGFMLSYEQENHDTDTLRVALRFSRDDPPRGSGGIVLYETESYVTLSGGTVESSSKGAVWGNELYGGVKSVGDEDGDGSYDDRLQTEVYNDSGHLIRQLYSDTDASAAVESTALNFLQTQNGYDLNLVETDSNSDGYPESIEAWLEIDGNHVKDTGDVDLSAESTKSYQVDSGEWQPGDDYGYVIQGSPPAELTMIASVQDAISTTKSALENVLSDPSNKSIDPQSEYGPEFDRMPADNFFQTCEEG